MKILTSNIKGSAAFGWSNKEIKSQLVDELFEENADIVVLTEFVLVKGIDYLFEQFNDKYIYFNSSISGKNGIFIAVKRNLVDSKKFRKNITSGENFIYSNTEGCNILKINIPLIDHGNLVIVGCRMETSIVNKDLQKQYDSERECFDNILIPAIKPMNKDCKYIVCGDFNNAQCRGSLNKKFNHNDYKGYAQCNYNLNFIMDAFEELGFEMIDKSIDGKPIMTCKKTDKSGKVYWFPDDHIFAKGFRTKPIDIPTIETEFSDHKMLIGEIESEDEI